MTEAEEGVGVCVVGRAGLGWWSFVFEEWEERKKKMGRGVAWGKVERMVKR